MKYNMPKNLTFKLIIIFTIYIGDPHNVAAIISPGRNLAKPKSAKTAKEITNQM